MKKKLAKAPGNKLRIHRETLRRLTLQQDELKVAQGGVSAVNGTCHPSPAGICMLSVDTVC